MTTAPIQPEMAVKTDMYDWTTPSGQVPFVVSPSQWRWLQSEGVDMRWYVASRPIPKIRLATTLKQGE